MNLIEKKIITRAPNTFVFHEITKLRGDGGESTTAHFEGTPLIGRYKDKMLPMTPEIGLLFLRVNI